MVTVTGRRRRQDCQRITVAKGIGKPCACRTVEGLVVFAQLIQAPQAEGLGRLRPAEALRVIGLIGVR